MNKNISDSDLIKLFNQNTLFRLFNLTVLEEDTKEGIIKVEFDVDKQFCFAAGDVQGGIVSGMVDDATALAFIFQNKFRKRPPTIELKTNFLYPKNLVK
jgi:acyl-coenzyme A thioesterase PaaI-like protein